MRMISKTMKNNDIETVNNGNNDNSCNNISYNINNNNNHENHNDNNNDDDNNNDNDGNHITNSNKIYLNKTQCETTRLCILQVREKILNQQHSSLNPALRARFDEEIDRLYNVAPDSFEDSNSMEPVSNHYPSVESRQLSANSAEAIKSRKNKEDKYCGVCGDRALGYNFDAISCESCKAFFRRNAPKGLDYFKCPYEEKCKMDVSNRRFCKKCRLRKCFEIGMRKEYILTEEEKMRKRQRIEENRKIREIEKQKMQSGDVSTTQNRLRMLESDEHSMISEVIGAYRQSLEISVESSYSRNNPSVIDLVNIAELSVRRVIDMAKKIKSFKALSQSDQISLLKGGSIELLIIRSVINFDRDKQQFLDPYDKDSNAMTTEQLKLGEGTLFDDHMKFVKSLAVDLRADETVLIILLVISLFSPDRPNVIDKSYVWREQDKYALLLQHYLESKFPYHLAHVMYPKLLMKLVEIRNLNEEHSQVLLKVNPEGIQPLMKEVLDLNLPKTNNK